MWMETDDRWKCKWKRGKKGSVEIRPDKCERVECCVNLTPPVDRHVIVGSIECFFKHAIEDKFLMLWMGGLNQGDCTVTTQVISCTNSVESLFICSSILFESMVNSNICH